MLLRRVSGAHSGSERRMSGASWAEGKVRLEIPFSIPGVSTVMMLESEGKANMIECGDGAASYLYSVFGRKLEQYERLSSVIVSHEHLDHAGGLNSVLWLLEVAGRRGDLNVVTPEGSTGAAYKSAKPMIAKLKYKVHFLDSSEKRRIKIGGLRIESFDTRHRDSFPSNRCGDPVASVGYSVEAEGSRIVFSGDTGPVSALQEKCSSADLAVIESTWEKPVDCEGLHLTVKEAMEYGALAGETIMVHPLRDRQGNIIL